MQYNVLKHYLYRNNIYKNLMPHTKTLSEHPNLPLLLLMLRENLMDILRPAISENGFTDQQWRIVRELYIHGPLQPKDLCEKCCILSPSMAGILNRMQKLNMIIKSPHDNDNRRIIISLNPYIIEKIENIIKKNKELYNKIWQLGGEQNMHQFIFLIEHLNKQVKKIKTD